jgi:hypothetical protein
VKASAGGLNGETERSGGVAHPVVVRHHRSQIVAGKLCRSEVNRVKTAQQNIRRQVRRAIEQLDANDDLTQASELATCLAHGAPATGPYGAYDLDSSESARYELVRALPSQETPQCV